MKGLLFGAMPDDGLWRGYAVTTDGQPVGQTSGVYVSRKAAVLAAWEEFRQEEREIGAQN